MRLNRTIALMAAAVAALASPAWAIYDVIIDDTQENIDAGVVRFMDWGSGLKTATGDSSYGGSYHYVHDWGTTESPSARVRYYLPPLPAGPNSYIVSIWSPTAHADQWHIVNATSDDTNENYQYYHGSGDGPNANVGGWVVLGPTFSDPAASDPKAYVLDGSTGHPAYLYIKYQPWYNADIAFDAIRVTQVPEPATLAGLGLMGLLAFRRRRPA